MSQVSEFSFSRLDLEVDIELVARLDRAGPRYTSYPTANRFSQAFGRHDYQQLLTQCATDTRPLSLYFHLPFCASLCYFCACNKIVTRDTQRAVTYVNYLIKEMELQAKQLGARRAVSQLHWGGGTPTFLPAAQRLQLMTATRRIFKLQDDAEISIEIDPRKVDADAMQQLSELGFNRISVGVQDFDDKVQRAVNRVQSVQQTREVIESGRAAGVQSVNLDLIYGLPLQTLESFTRTLDQVLALDPDRLSVYNYAHLPDRFMPQTRIKAADLPTPAVKLQLLKLAIERLTANGYVYIGMDHFAKRDDELTRALNQGLLQRNFQGYSTHADSDMVAFGITAIGKVGGSYSQNVKTLEAYYQQLDAGQLPIAKGILLTDDDDLRRTIISSLMCRFSCSIEILERRHNINFHNYFAAAIPALEYYRNAGLLTLDADWLRVTPKGRLLIRNICMLFDAYLNQGDSSATFSRVI